MRLFRRAETGSTLDLLVAGLGNPGREYESTRHNAGWMVLDELVRRHDGSWRSKFSGQLAEIRIDDRNELRWFNTDAFTVPAEDAKGTATVGQILGPSFYQWDLSMRKNFRFGGHYVVSPIFDVFNLFNRLNLGAPNTDVSNLAYGTINSAQPSRQFQLGVKFDF